MKKLLIPVFVMMALAMVAFGQAIQRNAITLTPPNTPFAGTTWSNTTFAGTNRFSGPVVVTTLANTNSAFSVDSIGNGTFRKVTAHEAITAQPTNSSYPIQIIPNSTGNAAEIVGRDNSNTRDAFTVSTNGDFVGKSFTGDGSGLTGVTATLPPGAVTNLFLEQFGCVADGRVFTTASATNGNPVITVSGAAFTSSDVGKSALIYNDITNINYSLGTILSVQSATQCTISTNALRNWTNGGTFVYGTDNTLSYSNADAAAFALGMATLHAKSGIYMFSGTPTKRINQAGAMTNWAVLQLAQAQPLNIPARSVSVVGETPPPQALNGHLQMSLDGTVFYIASKPTNSIAAGRASFMLDTPTDANWGICKHIFKNITFMRPLNSHVTVWDAVQGGPFKFENCDFSPHTPTNFTDQFSINQLWMPPAWRDDTNTVPAVICPGASNNGDEQILGCTFTSCGIGTLMQNHLLLRDNWYVWCGTALLADNNGGMYAFGDNNYFFVCSNTLSIKATVPSVSTWINLLTTGLEIHQAARDTIYDPSNYCIGTFEYYGEKLTNFTSTHLRTYSINIDNFQGDFYSENVRARNLIGGGTGITNTAFSSLMGVDPIQGINWAVPSGTYLNGPGGVWRLQTDGVILADDQVKVRANGTVNPQFTTEFGSTWASLANRRSAPSIGDLNNAASGVLWSSNGVWNLSGSLDGSTVYGGLLAWSGMTSFSAATITGNGSGLTNTTVTYNPSTTNYTYTFLGRAGDHVVITNKPNLFLTLAGAVDGDVAFAIEATNNIYIDYGGNSVEWLTLSNNPTASQGHGTLGISKFGSLVKVSFIEGPLSRDGNTFTNLGAWTHDQDAGTFNLTNAGSITVGQTTTTGATNIAPAGFVLATFFTATAPTRWITITNAGTKYLIPAYAQ